MGDARTVNWVDRISFGVRQGSRVAWYAGHGLMMRRMLARIDAAEAGKPDAPPPVKVVPPSRPVPTMTQLLGGVAKLLSRDMANVERGLYPMPQDDDGGLARLLATSRAFLKDVPEVARRRRHEAHQEVWQEQGQDSTRPRYYMQNFHFQSGGWMTEESARIYDMQVEVLFSGAANAMRRQALVPMAEELARIDQRAVSYADIACGTGSFLIQVRRAFPRLRALAIDLSDAYLRETRQRTRQSCLITPILAKAENLPLADGALDLATSIYLFHELPPKVRPQVARELARVIRPGGLFVFVDSLQIGDDPDYDGLLELFPRLFHEPYYQSYLDTDLIGLFQEAGFEVETDDTAFVSKIVSLRRI